MTFEYFVRLKGIYISTHNRDTDVNEDYNIDDLLKEYNDYIEKESTLESRINANNFKFKDFIYKYYSTSSEKYVYDNLNSLLEEYNKYLQKQEPVILATERDKQVFFDAVENPREPNDALKEAFKKQKDFFEED